MLDGRLKTLFIHFMRSALRWVPEERPAAFELVAEYHDMQNKIAEQNDGGNDGQHDDSGNGH